MKKKRKMNKVLNFLKQNALIIAMISGAIGYKYFSILVFLSPYLVFLMLFLSFSRVDYNGLKPGKKEFGMLAIQILGGFLIYFACKYFDETIAQSLLGVIICPTATAAAVVTTKIGGNATKIVCYTILINIVVAIIVPLTFPLIHPIENMNFWDSFVLILSKIFPQLICPLIAVFILKKCWSKGYNFIREKSSWSFWLWVISLTIIIAKVFKTIFTDDKITIHIIISLGISSMIICGILFFVGKRWGAIFDAKISYGQALGQKNTVFGIWLMNTYLIPISALGCGFYIIWQNLFNSWQIKRKIKEDALKNKTNN